MTAVCYQTGFLLGAHYKWSPARFTEGSPRAGTPSQTAPENNSCLPHQGSCRKIIRGWAAACPLLFWKCYTFIRLDPEMCLERFGFLIRSITSTMNIYCLSPISQGLWAFPGRLRTWDRRLGLSQPARLIRKENPHHRPDRTRRRDGLSPTGAYSPGTCRHCEGLSGLTHVILTATMQLRLSPAPRRGNTERLSDLPKVTKPFRDGAKIQTYAARLRSLFQTSGHVSSGLGSRDVRRNL